MVGSFRVQKAQIVVFILCTFLYLIWFFTLNFSEIPTGYRITAFLPEIYTIVFLWLLWVPFTQNRTPFIVVYCVMQFMRFVVLSIITLNTLSNGATGLFGRGLYSDEKLIIAGLLMIYELIMTASVINFSSIKNRRISKKKIIFLSYNSKIYVLCFAVSLVILFLFPQVRTGLTFLVGYDTEGDVEKLSIAILLAREFFVTAKYFLLFAVIKIFFNKVKINNFDDSNNRGKILPLIIILTVCLIVVGLRIGTNRKRIIADAVACIVIIISLFPQYKRTVISFFGFLSLMLVISTTVFRGATESMATFGADLFSPASLQSYLCGQYNICCALTTAEIYGDQISLGTLLYTLARSCFGIGTLISNFDMHTLSYYYNQIASIGYSYLRESQIIPMIGEGAIYFTSLFAPLLSMVYVYIGVLVDRIYMNTSRLEYRFMSVVIGVYLGQALSLASNIIINNISFKLAIFLPIVFIANRIRIGAKL